MSRAFEPGPNDFPEQGCYEGDLHEMGQQICSSSVPLIFCDPPYARKDIPLYGAIAELAARVLRPGGFLLCYCGNVWKDDVMQELRRHLIYHWDFATVHAGMGTCVWNRRVIARHKSILAFSKGRSRPRVNTLGLWNGTGQDKRYHRWGQDESTARYYIDCFTAPGDLVLDPCAGGGTTAIAARAIGRRWLCFDIDPNAVATARQRLREEPVPQLPALVERMGLEVTA